MPSVANVQPWLPLHAGEHRRCLGPEPTWHHPMSLGAGRAPWAGGRGHGLQGAYMGARWPPLPIIAWGPDGTGGGLGDMAGQPASSALPSPGAHPWAPPYPRQEVIRPSLPSLSSQVFVISFQPCCFSLDAYTAPGAAGLGSPSSSAWLLKAPQGDAAGLRCGPSSAGLM